MPWPGSECVVDPLSDEFLHTGPGEQAGENDEANGTGADQDAVAPVG